MTVRTVSTDHCNSASDDNYLLILLSCCILDTPYFFCVCVFNLRILIEKVLILIGFMAIFTGYKHRVETRALKHGKASSRFDYVPEAARNCNRTTLWERWWEMCNMWFLCASLHTGANLWWVQLWILPRSMRYLRRGWYIRCLLLQRVHTTGER